MLAKQWRAIGFHVITRGGVVWLVPSTETGACYSAHVSEPWNEVDDTSAPPWRATAWERLHFLARRNFSAVLASCYCSSMVDGSCDYCTGTRHAPDVVTFLYAGWSLMFNVSAAPDWRWSAENQEPRAKVRVRFAKTRAGILEAVRRANEDAPVMTGTEKKGSTP